MKKYFAFTVIWLLAFLFLVSCAESSASVNENLSDDMARFSDSVDFSEIPNGFHDSVPYDAMLNLEVINGLFRFQRIAVTPCIVYSESPIDDMTEGMEYDDRHDILNAVFRIMDGKEAGTGIPECDYSHYIYLFDKEREDVPWHYRFAIGDSGTVLITDNDLFLCTIELSAEEIRSILELLGIADAKPSDAVDLDALREKFPQYFSLADFKGIEVYVWKNSENEYRCGMMTGTNRMKNVEEIAGLESESLSVEEAAAILTELGIEKDDIIILPVIQPYSGGFEFDGEYGEEIIELFQ